MAREVTVTVTNHGTGCVAYYNFEYKLTGDTGYTALDPQPTGTFKITNLQDSQTYDYRITRFCCDGSVSTTGTGTFDTGIPLSTPTGFTATGGDQEITLEWDNDTDADNYIIERDIVNTFTSPVEVYNGAYTSSYVDAALDPSTTYYYRIKAQGSGFADSPYAYANAATDDQLETPTSFTATPAVTTIDLTWDNDVNADTYVIERAEDAGFTIGLTTVYNSVYVSSVSDGGVISGTTYYYRIHSEATGYSNSAYAYDNAIAP